MKVREYTSKRSWTLVGPVLPGGTVYSLVVSPNSEQQNPVVAGTPVGVFRSLSYGDNWSWANRGLTGLQASATAVSSNGVLFLGTLDGSFARSVDGGYSWLVLPRLDVVDSITAISVSPDYLNDGTVFIGTEENGIFRSTDSGRTSKAVNFGLDDPAVLCLSCAAGWPKKPVAFAGTASGLYRSTNGGRAWRLCEDLDGIPIQAVSASPQFDKDGIVFAASEEDGLYRSKDGGKSWQRIGDAINDTTFNAIWISPSFPRDHVVLVGTASSGIYRSEDGGETWQSVLDTGQAVLTIAGDATGVFAGFHGTGVYRSQDNGNSWQPCQNGLSANPFTSLAVTNDERLFVAGPDTGIYTSTDAQQWQPLAGLPAISSIAAFAVALDYEKYPVLAIAGADDGLYLSTNNGDSWAQSLCEPVTAVCLAPDSTANLYIAAGTKDGRFFTSKDGGANWASIDAFNGSAVIRLEASPCFAKDNTLVAATTQESEGTAPVRIWRSTDAGQNWKVLFEEAAMLKHTNFAIDPSNSDRLCLAMDRYFFREGQDGAWSRSTVGPDKPPVLSVVLRQADNIALSIVGTTMGTVLTEDGVSWWPMMRGMGFAPILALAPMFAPVSQPVWGMSLGGIIWKWDLATSQE